MKNRQIRLIIGVLVGLVLFSSSLALLFYTKQEGKELQTQELIQVNVANKKLARGEIIASNDIKEMMLPKSYITTTPLMSNEIIGRYTNVDIFEGELFRAEKLSLEAVQTQTVQSASSEPTDTQKPLQDDLQLRSYDTVMLPLTLFQNLDTTLKKGDIIDIVSTLPHLEQTNLNQSGRDFKTKYIATKIEIDSFVFGGQNANTLVGTNKEGVATYADGVVLIMEPKEIKNFFSAYYKTQELNANRVYNTSQTNKGHLWMIKCAKIDEGDAALVKERLMVDFIAVQAKKAVQRARVAKKEQVSISYEE